MWHINSLPLMHNLAERHLAILEIVLLSKAEYLLSNKHMSTEGATTVTCIWCLVSSPSPLYLFPGQEKEEKGGHFFPAMFSCCFVYFSNVGVIWVAF
jgi:hypothetical protein